jgi:hypothetical protein
MGAKSVFSLVDHYRYVIGMIYPKVFDILQNQIHYARETLPREGRVWALFFPCI